MRLPLPPLATLRLAAAGAFAAALLGLPADAAAATCNGRPCIYVGAFNIKLLGNGGPADTPAEYGKIATLVADTMKLDVVVLEEINVAGAQWPALRTVLEAKGYKIAFQSPFGGENKQHVVIAYRSAAVTLIDPAPTDLPFPTSYSEPNSACAYGSVRPPVTAAFRAGAFDFQVVGVHLKSQIPIGGAGAQCDDRIRTNQAKRIVGFIASSPEKDVLVLGDFNSAFAATENDPFRAAGLRTVTDDLAAGSGSQSYVGNPRSLIDQIVVRAGDPNYVPHSGYVQPLSAADRPAYLASVSDHVPIRAAFYTDQDPD